jgi:hypothetical protein
LKLSEIRLQNQDEGEQIKDDMEMLGIFELRIIAWIMLGLADKASTELDYVMDTGSGFQKGTLVRNQFENMSFCLAKIYCELPAWNGNYMMALDRLHHLQHWLISVRTFPIRNVVSFRE